MGLPPAQKIVALLRDPVQSVGLDLEDVSVRKAGKRSVVVVIVDRDGGVDLDAIADVSRTISDALDTSELFGDSPYVLEVSSPGVDRPLTQPVHWRRAVGRLVKVDLVDGSTKKGRVVSADQTSAELDLGKNVVWVAFDQVAKAVVEVEFTRKDDQLVDLSDGNTDSEETDFDEDDDAAQGEN